MFKALAVTLFVAFLLTPALVRADSTGPEYQINGTLTMTGAGTACGGSACVENIAYSFLLDYSLVPAADATLPITTSGPDIYLAQIVGPVTISSSGPLDYLEQITGESLGTDKGYYLALGDSTGSDDELDLYMGGIETDASLGTPAPYAIGGKFYSCESATCATDFDDGVPYWGWAPIPTGTAQLTAKLVAVPEPSTFLLLVVGIIAVSWLGLRRFIPNRLPRCQ